MIENLALWFVFYVLFLRIEAMNKTHRFLALRYPAALSTLALVLLLLGIKLYART